VGIFWRFVAKSLASEEASYMNRQAAATMFAGEGKAF